MGLLDVFNTEEGRLGLGLLSAAAPRSDGANFGQRLSEGIGYVDSWKKSNNQQKKLDAEFAEQMAIDAERQGGSLQKFAGLLQSGQPDAAYAMALQSRLPELRQIGTQGFSQMPQMAAQKQERQENRDWRTQEAQASRDARAQEMQAKLSDARTSQAERLAAQKELREMQITAQRDMKQFGASLASGMRQPEAPIAVMGPDGKSIYVSRADALGKTPASAEKGKGGPMSVTLQKELLESDDTAQSAKNVVGILENAKKINANAYSGYFAKGRATFASNMPGKTPGADATIDIDNMMTGQALESLKSIFGGMPTEGERKILLEMQASVDKTPEQREAIMNRAMAAAKRRGEYAGTKAKSIRDGSYLTQGMPELAPVDPPKPDKTIVRTGTLNGRKVNQYSDGTTDYAN